jgi:CRISPR-associated protein Cas1
MADRANTEKSPFALGDDTDWADRCEYWADYRPKSPGRNKKYNYRHPLVLCGHGIRISIHRNTLLIKQGLTHYPQQLAELRYFPGDPNLPDRIIILDASGAITLDALAWMSDQKIALVQLNWRGQVTFSGNGGFHADPKLVRWQVEIQGTAKARELNRQLICAKFDASISTLSTLFKASDASKIAIQRIRDLKSKISNPKLSYNSILGLEGAAAAIYYRLWHDLPVNWSRLSKRPIPPDWLKVGARQMIWQRAANNARHPINAMLNYGYAVLISHVQTAIISAGFDPTIGIAHKRHKNPLPLVYDLMEPLRPVVDRAVLEFSCSQTFKPGDFTINKYGGCRLNPQLAKVVAKQLAQISAGGIVDRFLRPLH